MDFRRWTYRPPPFFYLILVLALAGIYYRITQFSDLHNTGLVYLGLPLLMALGFALLPRSQSALSTAMKGTTIALLLSGIIFLEGYICILFAAPIFYGLAALIGVLVDRARRNPEKRKEMALVATILALLSLEGTMPMTTVPREHTVVVSRTIPADMESVRKQLAQTPSFDDDKPLFLKIFPYPVQIEGEGLVVGDIRQAKFVAYKQIWWNRVEGMLAFKVIESEPHRIKFAITRDDSYVSHYLKWLSSEVHLESVEEGTLVTWKHEYTRLLDPAWYFGFLQYYAVKLTTEQLIERVATPPEARA